MTVKPAILRLRSTRAARLNRGANLLCRGSARCTKTLSSGSDIADGIPDRSLHHRRCPNRRYLADTVTVPTMSLPPGALWKPQKYRYTPGLSKRRSNLPPLTSVVDSKDPSSAFTVWRPFHPPTPQPCPAAP